MQRYIHTNIYTHIHECKDTKIHRYNIYTSIYNGKGLLYWAPGLQFLKLSDHLKTFKGPTLSMKGIFETFGSQSVACIINVLRS